MAPEVAAIDALVQSYKRMCEVEALEVDFGCPETLLAEFERLTDEDRAASARTVPLIFLTLSMCSRFVVPCLVSMAVATTLR